MLSAVVPAVGARPRLIEVQPPPSGDGEVVIEVAASGICHTDLRRDGLVTGATAPVGYQERVLAKATSVIPAPATLGAVHLAPLMCAGLAAFTVLLCAGPLGGKRVAAT